VTTALVLGASRGIGREFVRQLLAAGWQVYASARDDKSLAELNAGGAHAFKLDVTRVESLSGLSWMLDGVQLDLALYVAGVYGPPANASQAPQQADFDAVMHANVLGAMQVLPLVGPAVEAAHGQFAFITSGMGSIANAQSSEHWVYRASKAALNMVVRAAAMDYPKATLLALSPGWVRTDMGGPAAPLSVTESVSGMLRGLSTLTQGDTGSFIDHNGKMLPW
jgi:NAD(P)-dependent dehydrogenase (short-subunit alcohol dehydrogenase family)